MSFEPNKATILNLLTGLTTASGTNNDTYGIVQKNAYHKGIRIWVPRTADTGTCTLDVYMQGLKPGGTETTDAHWYDVSGKLIVTYADGETGVYVGDMYPRMTSVTGGFDTISTTTSLKVAHSNGYLPDTFRLRFRNGGTTVTNTIGTVLGLLLP